MLACVSLSLISNNNASSERVAAGIPTRTTLSSQLESCFVLANGNSFPYKEGRARKRTALSFFSWHPLSYPLHPSVSHLHSCFGRNDRAPARQVAGSRNAWTLRLKFRRRTERMKKILGLPALR